MQNDPKFHRDRDNGVLGWAVVVLIVVGTISFSYWSVSDRLHMISFNPPETTGQGPAAPGSPPRYKY
jgi:hypothetical protein